MFDRFAQNVLDRVIVRFLDRPVGGVDEGINHGYELLANDAESAMRLHAERQDIGGRCR